MAKETDLTRSFLIYAASCLRQGDLSALRDIGFTEREADAVGKLTIRQLALLEEKLEGGLLRASLDSEAFWCFIAQLEREEELDGIKVELARRDAPWEMMRRLFGTGQRQYAALRNRVEAPAGVGRPKEPDEESIRVVWLAWERIVGGGEPRPAQWLQIAEETGVPLRILWRLGQGWQERRRPVGLGLRGQDQSPGAICGSGTATQRRAGG